MFVQVTFGMSLSIVVGGITLAGALAVAKALAGIATTLTALIRLIDLARARHESGRGRRATSVLARKRRRAHPLDWLKRARIGLFRRQVAKIGAWRYRSSQRADERPGYLASSVTNCLAFAPPGCLALGLG